MRIRSARPAAEQLETRLTPSLTYHGGSVIPHVEVEPVYYGSNWAAPAQAQQASALTAFLGNVVNSSYMGPLAENGAGRGTETGAGLVDTGISAGQTVDDSAIQAMLKADIAHGLLHGPDGSRLYVVYTGPNITVTEGGQSSRVNFYGYHGSFDDGSGHEIDYAVIAHPVGNGDYPTLNDFQTLTNVTSHELVEAVTDPNGGGWWEDASGEENADLANSPRYLGTVNGYTVSGYWLNSLNGIYVPGGAAAAPTPAPSPPAPAPAPGAAPAAAPPNLGATAAALTHSAEAYADFIATAYAKYLGRGADAPGLAARVGRMQQGLTDEQLEAGFLASPEYALRHGGVGAGWVTGMYQDLLGRTPSGGEVAYWTSRLASGVSAYDVAFGFAASTERESARVAGDYWTYLGRAASQAEVNYWVGHFAQGMTNEDVATGFLGSQEYFQNARKGNSDPATWVVSAYRDALHRDPAPVEVQAWVAVL